MVCRDAELQGNAEKVERMQKVIQRLLAQAYKAPNGLVYGVPERWLRRPDKLNPMDFQRLVEAARV
jgi:hypothetical protein